MANEYRYSRIFGDHTFENRFATEEEIRLSGILSPVRFGSGKEPKDSGIPVLTDGKEAEVLGGDTHSLIIGATGSMKTRAVLVPTLLSIAEKGENLVVSDPKGEIFDLTSGYLEKLGYEVRCINFRDMSRSNRWNPLLSAYERYEKGDVDGAVELVVDLTKMLTTPFQSAQDPYWQHSADHMLQGAIELLMAVASGPQDCNMETLSTLMTMINAVSGDGDGDPMTNRALRTLVNALPDSSRIRGNLAPVFGNAPNTRRCITSMAQSAIDCFANSDAALNLTSESTFSIGRLGGKEGKIAIFIIVPDEKSNFDFITASFVKEMYSEAIAMASRSPGRKLPRRLNFLLDEFANIPAIPDMTDMISAARSRNIRFHLVLQSNAQLEGRYGKADAETIKTNCQTWVYLYSRETSMLTEIQQYVGADEDGKPLLTLSDIERIGPCFPKVNALVMMPRMRPYLASLADYSLYPALVDEEGKAKLPPVDIRLPERRQGGRLEIGEELLIPARTRTQEIAEFIASREKGERGPSYRDRFLRPIAKEGGKSDSLAQERRRFVNALMGKKGE